MKYTVVRVLFKHLEVYTEYVVTKHTISQSDGGYTNKGSILIE